MIRRCDAIIVGGGPAGALCALHFSRMGWNVVLVERHSANRHKACGHCLSPRAFPLLARAGVLDATHALAGGDYDHLQVHGLDRNDVSIALTRHAKTSRGLLVARDKFDAMLRNAAASHGAHIMYRNTARMLEQSSDCVLVELRSPQRIHMQTSLLIGADGVGSGVARAAGLLADGNVGRKFGFSCTIPVKSDSSVSTIAAAWSRAIHMFLAPNGYLGAVMQNDSQLHLAGLVSRAAMEAGDAHPLKFVQQVAFNHKLLRDLAISEIGPTKTSGLIASGPMPWRTRAIVNGRVALIGDAAGYIEPFTGEGMAWALHSAELLAEVVSETQPGEWNDRLATAYQQRWRDCIMRQQNRCRAIAYALERPRLMRAGMRVAETVPAIASHFARQVVGA